MRKGLVGIVIGSDSDLVVMEETAKVLREFGIPHEVTIASAHRSPKIVESYARNVEKKGLRVIIAGAGGAAHLAGVLASRTTLPVIAVPLNSPLRGLDSFYSTLQMPHGVPVATMGIGKAGAKNAAILAAQILSMKYPRLKRQLKRYKLNLSRQVKKKGSQINSLL